MKRWLHTKFSTSLLASMVLLAVTCLAGCSATARFDVDSANYLNPDINGDASPVLVTVYQLKNGYAFQQADYESLTDNAAKTLGDDIIDKNSFEVQPSSKFTTSEKVYPNTKFIGVVAAYRDPNSVSWHKVVQLNKPGQSISILLDLESEGISVKPN